MKEYQLAGQRFGRLQVIEKAYNKNRNTYWKCVCDCGNVVVKRGVSLKRGETKSCGCYNRDLTIARNKSWAYKMPQDKRLYGIYYGMRTRCYNKTDSSYRSYGARGITVCDEWLEDFYAFQDWAFSNGYREDLSIDRIDNNGNYSPENCRWADNKTQANNRRTTHFLTIDGETHSASQWARMVGVDRSVIYGRLKHGWSDKDAVFTPLMTQFSSTKRRKEAV